jgi:hypothetical protein
MSEFVGRTGSNRVYSYPETPRGASALSALARNFAFGPDTSTDIDTAPTPVPWAGMDVGAPGINVPITPRATGIIRISGVLNIKSASGIQEAISLVVIVDSVEMPVPFFERPTFEAGARVAIPFLTELNAATFGAPLTVGVTSNVVIAVTASNPDVLSLPLNSSTMDVQEVPVATG